MCVDMYVIFSFYISLIEKEKKKERNNNINLLNENYSNKNPIII